MTWSITDRSPSKQSVSNWASRYAFGVTNPSTLSLESGHCSPLQGKLVAITSHTLRVADTPAKIQKVGAGIPSFPDHRSWIPTRGLQYFRLEREAET